MLPTSILRALLSAAVVAVGLSAATALMAQQPAPPPAVELPELNEETLAAFAEAYLDVSAITQRADEAIAGEPDQERVEQIRAATREELEEAVEERGFTLQQYEALKKALERDEELRDRFAPILERARKQREDGAPSEG